LLDLQNLVTGSAVARCSTKTGVARNRPRATGPPDAAYYEEVREESFRIPGLRISGNTAGTRLAFSISSGLFLNY